jgi:CRP-like cAMP-binding protein
VKSVSIEVEFPLVAKDPVSFLRANEWFWIGDAAVLRDAPRIVSVRAGAESTVLYLSGEDTKKVLQDQPEQWLAFHDPATRNAAQAVALLAEALALTVRARVCRLLAPSEDSKEVRITQDDLAKTLSIARPTLGRCLKDLEERSAVKIKYRNLLILDRQVFPHFQDEQ